MLVLLSAVMTGCATVGPVVVNATSFYVDDFQPEGVIVVMAGDPELSGSLEFAHYKKRFEAQLAANGYSVTQDIGEADYAAFVTFGIDDGNTRTVSTPIIGQTGGGTTYTSGTVYGTGGMATYSGSSYTMPSYGVVGVAAGTQTTYKRAVAIDIVDAPSLKSGTPGTVYEGRITSEGTCNVINEVFDEMLQGLFTNWPGESGKNRNLRVPSMVDC